MSQQQKRPEAVPEKAPPAPSKAEEKVASEDDLDLSDIDDLRGAQEKILQRWKQVGQTGGQ